jgi:serine/threonine-protein kinase HipA
MKTLKIKCCPSFLSPGFNTYSPKALRTLFGGKKVSHVLEFNSPKADPEVSAMFRENRNYLSISGVQLKQSLLLEKNKLRLTVNDEQGTYILKPVPYHENFEMIDDLPANEHLTMQIASQVYGINTAASGLIFFKNGEPAYITKRFDVAPGGKKISQEDFSVLLGVSLQLNGAAFKSEGSYQKIAEVMKEFVPAYMVESEKYFKMVLFNYLFSNGDAHLRNFSLQQLPGGDYVLSPAYDLINTRIHIKNDTAMALKNGLFEDDYYTESFEINGFYAYDDFYEFGIKIGLKQNRMLKILNDFRTPKKEVGLLVKNSFLSRKSKLSYIELYNDKLRALNYSYSKLI